MPPEAGIPNGQHVTFPSHIRVPRALKNGLTFGSFSAGFGLEIKDDNGSACNNKDIVALSKEGDETSNGSSRLVNIALLSLISIAKFLMF